MNCTDEITNIKKYDLHDLRSKLKQKILCETEKLTHLLNRGYRPDLQFLMSELRLSELLVDDSVDRPFKEFATQYYLNNIWKT